MSKREAGDGEHDHGTGEAVHSVERATRLNAREHRIKPGEIAVGVVIGGRRNSSTSFTMRLPRCGLPERHISFVDRLTGTLYSFAMFALAFIARPIGARVPVPMDRPAHSRKASS